jgi:hypothetical protein
LNDKPYRGDLMEGFISLFSLPCIKKKDNNDKLNYSHHTHNTEDMCLLAKYDSMPEFYESTNDFEISYNTSSSEERSIEINSMSYCYMKDLDLENDNYNDNIINREFFNLISYENYLPLYPNQFVDCSSNNNYFINSHMEISFVHMFIFR